MEPALFPILQMIFSIIFFLNLSPFILSQPITNTNTTDFSCSLKSSSTHCSTYVVYRSQSPEFMDPGNISDLFGISRLSIIRSNNLPSEDITLSEDQLLLIPITCSCNGNRSFFNTSYQIRDDDTFYSVSIHQFENLTDYHAVEDFNPTLDPTKLMAGQDAVFPLFCKCPTKTQFDQGTKYLITYTWQPSDNLHDLSKLMNTSGDDIFSENNYRNLSAAICLPILIPVSKPPLFPQLQYYKKDLDSKSSSKFILIFFIVVAAVLALALVCLSVFVYSKFYRKKPLIRIGSSSEGDGHLEYQKSYDCMDLSHEIRGEKLLIGVSEYLDKPMFFHINAIREATMNFDERYQIGNTVYRATINGDSFAVKQAKGDATEEVQMLQKVNHANLVKLRGVSCDDSNNYFFFVYEFAEHGSLDKWLYPQRSSTSSGNLLSWRQRLNVAWDVAKGLQYLHEHTVPSVVHGDIKTTNVLLTSQFRAKISNFSKAKPATISTAPCTDVFSFGVVLLELLSGRKDGDMMITSIRKIFAENQEKRGEMLRVWMDANLEGCCLPEGALSLANIARACTSDTAMDRPSMGEIVLNLSVLVQCSINESERPWHPTSEENIQMVNSVIAR